MKAIKKIKEPKPSKLVVFSVLLFGGLFFVYFDSINNYSTTPKWIYLGLLGLVMVLIGRKQPIPWSLGIKVWYAFVVLYLVQCFGSHNFWDAVVRAIPLIIAPLLVLLLRREETDHSPFYSKISMVLAILILPLLLITLWGIVELVFSSEYSHLASYKFRFMFGNRNQYAQIIVLLIPLFSVGILSTNSKKKKLFLAVVIGLACATALLLLNRTSIIVLLGVYPVALVVYLLRNTGRKVKNFAYIFMIVTALVSIVIIASPARKSIPILNDLFETSYGSGNERLRIWSNSIELWKESPVLGKGSGDWKIEILKTPLEFTKAEDGNVFYQRAHNDFIQIAVENGVVGLILFLSFLIIGAIHLLKSNIDRSSKIFLFAGLIGFVLIANFSFPMERVELLILLFLFILPGVSKERSNDSFRLEKVGITLVFAAVFLLAFTWFRSELLYFKYKENNDLVAFEKIDKSFYTINLTSAPLEWQEANMYFGQKDYGTALTHYEKAYEYNPYHLYLINNLGSCNQQLGNIDEAEKHFKQVLELNPHFVATLMSYSSLQLNRGNVSGALTQILSVPVDKEPENYALFIETIAKETYKILVEIYEEAEFKNFLIRTYDDDQFLYDISVRCRKSGASYEAELRKYLAENPD
ncbi:MAG: O-antigen ligase [Crocinitomicaceae bacterium]|jgi:O-antigen ligase